MKEASTADNRIQEADQVHVFPGPADQGLLYRSLTCQIGEAVKFRAMPDSFDKNRLGILK